MAKAELGFELTQNGKDQVLTIRQIQDHRLVDPTQAKHFTVGSVQITSAEDTVVISPESRYASLPNNLANIILIQLADGLPMSGDKPKLFIAEDDVSAKVKVQENQTWIDSRVEPRVVKGRVVTIQAKRISEEMEHAGLVTAQLFSSYTDAGVHLAKERARKTMEKMQAIR